LNQETKTKIKTILGKYLPPETIDYLLQIFGRYPIHFHIVSPRKNKQGDFSVSPIRPPRITINSDLNPYAFLVTTIHEFAHYITWQEHKNQVKAHGQEWKDNFVKLMRPIVEQRVLPYDIEQALITSFQNVKAASCTDIQLFRTLQKYDLNVDSSVALENLPSSAIFTLNERIFKKETLRRTRYVCTELHTNKKFLIHRLALVEEYNNE